MNSALLIIFIFYSFGALVGPFPYWRSYFRLWTAIIENKENALPLKSRLRLSIMLLRHALLTPICNLLWQLDELIYPEYRSYAVNKVVVIIGQPRSGTTFLQRTLAADHEHFLSIRHIEWRFPYIIVQNFFMLLGVHKLISQLSYWPKSDLGRTAQQMHNHSLGDYEEDGIFFEERFLYHYFIFRRFPYPDLLNFLDDYSGVLKFPHFSLVGEEKLFL